MSEKKPIIQRITRTLAACPVCGKPSYSASGMHPQCAVARADLLSREERKHAAEAVSVAKRKAWSKACPKCAVEMPARRFVCNCGYRFAIPRAIAIP